MAEVAIDIDLISNFIKKANDPKASTDLKKLLAEWKSVVKSYIINGTDNKHYVVVEDENAFNELIGKIKKVVG